VKYTSDHMSPSESFSRGFWGGIGFFCGFMVLNFVVIVVGFIFLKSTSDMIRAESPMEMSLPHVGQQPAAERVEGRLPLRASARRP
jgi:uncharacterized membrane protein